MIKLTVSLLALISSHLSAATLPADNMIVFGDGTEKLVELADPMCATCQIVHYRYFDFNGNLLDKQLQLAILPVVLKSHPSSRNIIANIYCSADRASSWIKALTDSTYRESLQQLPDRCKDHLKTVDENNLYYEALGAQGTPHFIPLN